MLRATFDTAMERRGPVGRAVRSLGDVPGRLQPLALAGAAGWLVVVPAAAWLLPSAALDMALLAVAPPLAFASAWPLAARLAGGRAAMERAAFAHDLRAPLVTLGACFDLLESGARRDAPADDLRFAAARGSAVLAQLRDLLDEQLPSSPAPVTPAPAGSVPTASAGTVLADVITALDASIAAAGATVAATSALPRVPVSSVVLFRVLSNLVGNAIAHGATSQGPPRIEVSARRLEAGWEFAVRDSGPGFDATGGDLDRLFEPGRRGLTSAAGHGLGLAAVRRLVAAAGGRAWIDTASDGGCVRFTLPAVASTDVATVADEEATCAA